MHQQSSELLCNWTATSSPNMSEIDDNENDAGFGRSIPGLASGVYNDDSFEAIPDDLKNVEAFGRQNSYGNVGNCNGNGSQAYRPSPSNFRVKDEPHNPTGARMSQDFGFQEDSSMQIHHDLMFRRIMQDIFTTCSSLCLPTGKPI
ncbi:unnamed protein product [Bursaphelenchus okinawaensis]|uniref:Uncharacterized protein n=1 Tax=Bursaphelenchus okinawaensis TaxID=465554 RepID=A0A811KDQ5_9BILA|nr:unnamed protein product [Bursaphelenchus okinawaensis]CAG9101703.1 unnamed protein product [Bursaphelenchus okinawaensis]